VKKYANPAGQMILASLMPYVVGAVVLLYLYKRSQSVVPAKLAEVKAAAKSLRQNLPGVIEDKLRGRSEATYITQAEARRRAEAALAAKRMDTNLAPVLYGA
jgi:hypothetical protein